MKRTISGDIVVAAAHCLRKAFLLLCTKERGSPHDYARILDDAQQANQGQYLHILRQNNPDVRPYSPDTLRSKADFLINATLTADNLKATCAILSKIKGSSALGRHHYEPTLFVGTHTLTKAQKLDLFFTAHVLAKVQGKLPAVGRLIRLDGKASKVKLENSVKTLTPLLEDLQEWARADKPEPPLLILNKHCPACQFRQVCRTQAEQEDNLSLLDGISTARAIRKYEKKGLFSVKQLSYTFKPRKRKKRAKNPPPVVHKPELQALAIRTGKIYLQALPDLNRQPVELFLDIEAVPDRNFYYLIGLLVCEGDTTTYYPFWADSPADEATMWQQFLEQANRYPAAPIYHYGSFEPRTLAKLARRYETDGEALVARLVNVNRFVYGRVYFPVYSNRLKELGAFVGATWSDPAASGLQSLVWRHRWETTQATEGRERLLAYNEEDCRALQRLTDELSKIKQSADVLSEVDFANQPKRQATEVGEEVHSQFEMILKFAHKNYDKKKISFKPHKEKKNIKEQNYKKPGVKLGYQGQRKIRPKASKVIQIPLEKVCPKHKGEALQSTTRLSKRLIIDLVLTKNGIKKTITEYRGIQGYCSKCGKYHIPSGIRRYGVNQLYGYGFKAWVVYCRVAMRLPYDIIAEGIEEQFNDWTLYIFASYYI